MRTLTVTVILALWMPLYGQQTVMSGGVTVSGRVTFALACGPPNYACSNTGIAAVGTLSPLFSSTDGVNTTKYDTNLNPTGVNCITQLSDGNGYLTFGVPYTGNITNSGGDNDSDASLTGKYSAFSYNGKMYLYAYNTTGNCIQVIYPPPATNCFTTCDTSSTPFGFSHTTEALFYNMKGTTKTALTPNTIDGVGTATHYIPGGTLFDFANCPDTPSTYSTRGSGTVFSIAIDDNTFAQGIGWTSKGETVQNSLSSVYVWNRTLGCAAMDMRTGQWWNYHVCSTANCGGIAADGTQATCTYAGTNGVHEALMGYNADYVLLVSGHISGQPSGGCQQASNQTYAVWKIGTGTVTPATAGSGATGHNSAGALNALFLNNPNPTRIPWSTFPSGGVNFYTYLTTPADSHAVPTPSTDDNTTWTNGTICGPTVTTNGTTPPAFCNEIFGMFLQLNNASAPRFVNTYNTDASNMTFGCQEAIFYISQDRKWGFFASPMLNTYGNDSNGNQICRLFAFAMN